MAKFNYSAIDSNGREKSGKIDAANESEARSKLSGMGLMVNSVRAAAGGSTSGPSKSAKDNRPRNAAKKLSTEDLTIFTRQMATLLQSQLPLLRSLEVMIRQEKKPGFKVTLESIADNVRSGNNLSEGLAQFPGIFQPIYVNMVRAGEAGGVLDTVLSRLATFMEKDLKTRKKIQSAMIYPAVVITVAVVIVTLLMMFVVPSFQNIFNDMLKGAPLPHLTQIVINIAEFIKPGSFLEGIMLLGGLIVLIFVGKFALGSKAGRAVTDFLALRAPAFGDLGTKAAVSRFTRTFGTLLASGVPILQALQITRDVIGNQYISNALDKVHDRVRDGENLATPLDQQNIFPMMVTSMVEVGEETGELPAMLNRIADNYDEDVDNAVSSITSIIEPIMIVVLALVVGVIVIALFLPIIEIIRNLTQ